MIRAQKAKIREKANTFPTKEAAIAVKTTGKMQMKIELINRISRLSLTRLSLKNSQYARARF